MKTAEAVREKTPEHDGSPEPSGERLSVAEILKLQAEREESLKGHIDFAKVVEPDFDEAEERAKIAAMVGSELQRGALYKDLYHFSRFADVYDPAHDSGIEPGLGSGFEQGQVLRRKNHLGEMDRGWVFVGINPENGLAKIAKHETVTDKDGTSRQRRLWDYVSLNDLKRFNGSAETAPMSPEATAVAHDVGDTALDRVVELPVDDTDGGPVDRTEDTDGVPAEPKAPPTLSEELIAQTESSLNTTHEQARRLQESRSRQRELDRARIGQEIQAARADLRQTRRGRISAISERLFGNETFNRIADYRKQAYKEITEGVYKDAPEKVKKKHIENAKVLAKKKLKAERAEKRRLARNDILDAKVRRHALRTERRNLRRTTKAGGRNTYLENRRLVKNGFEMPYINTEGMTEAQRAELERSLNAIGRGKRAPRRA